MIRQNSISVAYLVAWNLSTIPNRPLVTERGEIKTSDLDHVVSTNIKYIHVNDVIEN